MDSLPLSNRRRTTRSPVTLRVSVDRDGAARPRALADLSLDGAFVRGEHAEPGAILRLAMGLGDGQPPLEARGVVVRAGCDGIGVRFTGMRTNDAVRIADRLYGDG